MLMRMLRAVLPPPIQPQWSRHVTRSPNVTFTPKGQGGLLVFFSSHCLFVFSSSQFLQHLGLLASLFLMACFLRTYIEILLLIAHPYTLTSSIPYCTHPYTLIFYSSSSYDVTCLVHLTLRFGASSGRGLGRLTLSSWGTTAAWMTSMRTVRSGKMDQHPRTWRTLKPATLHIPRLKLISSPPPRTWSRRWTVIRPVTVQLLLPTGPLHLPHPIYLMANLHLLRHEPTTPSPRKPIPKSRRRRRHRHERTSAAVPSRSPKFAESSRPWQGGF